MSNACDSFMAKWAEFNENTDMDPTDMTWSEFLNSPNYGLVTLLGSTTANSPQQLAANINRFFAEDNYNEELTAEEADFLWNLYQKLNTQVPNDVLVTCNVLNTIVNTPADQLATINWDLFDTVVSGSEEEDDQGFGGSEEDEESSQGNGAFTNQPSRVPFPAPNQVSASTFPNQPSAVPSQSAFPSSTPASSIGFMQSSFPVASQTPTLPPPAIGFNPGATNPLAPGISIGNTNMTSAGTQSNLPIPGGLLQNLQPQTGLSAAQNQTMTSQTTTTSGGQDLPYVTLVVKGLKAADQSRLLMLNVDDDGTGNSLQVAIFITAGAVPASVVNTTFGTEDYNFRDKEQKSQIHEQNKRSIANATQLIPYNLSNGSDEKGVCAQVITGYRLEPVGKTTQDCPGGNNVPKSTRITGSNVMQAPSGGPGASLFGQTSNRPTQPGLGQIPVGQTVFGVSVNPPQITSGGFTTPPTSGGTGLGPTEAPPGTRTITVPDFDKPGSFREAYQIPGGPHPIAVGKKVGQNPGTWYWYQLPNGSVIKSEQKYLGLLDTKAFNTKHGDKQLRRVEEILQLMRGQYGQNFNQVNQPPAGTGVVVAPKSSGRGKGKGKTAAPPAVGGFITTPGQLPPGFGPATNPNVIRAPATTVTPVQTGFQPSMFGGQSQAPTSQQTTSAMNMFNQPQEQQVGMTWQEFSSQRRNELKVTKPDLSNSEITRILSEEWAARKATGNVLRTEAAPGLGGLLNQAQPQFNFNQPQQPTTGGLPPGFQAALPPPVGTTPGVLQPQLPNLQAAPPPQSPFGAQAIPNPLAVLQQQPQQQPAPLSANNPLAALLQTSQQSTIPAGLFGQATKR